MIDNASPVDPRALLIALHQASYDWCLETDRLAWSAGAARVLGMADEAALASGQTFGRLLDIEASCGRREAILHGVAAEGGEGAAYCLRYACRAAGSSRRRWIEDRGRWFAGVDGRPALARGLLRVVAECEEGEAGASPRSGAGAGLRHVLARAGASGRQAALLLVAVHRLGAVAAEHGAVVADAVAAQVMRSLRSVMRIGDDLVSIADGKFALILSGCGAADLPRAAERFRHAAMAAAVDAEAGAIRPSVSIGGALLAPSAGDAGEALMRAQQALDRCERERPGGFVALTEEDEAQRAGAAPLLAQALDEDRIVLAFDPIADLGSGAGGRSLFRARPFLRRSADGASPNASWNTSWQPARLAPGGDPALARRFCRRLVALADAVVAGHPDVELLLPLPEAMIPAAGAADTRARLTLELDEAEARADLDGGGAAAAAMRASGARLAIAGFGAGRLSFEAVQALGAERLTLHGALVETAAQVAQGRFALRSLVEAATQRSIAIGAEWVDDDAMARLLAGWGCDRLLGAVAGPLRLDLPRPQAARRRPLPALKLTGT